MTKLIDEFRRGWQGISQPSLLFSVGFAVCCLALSTSARWGIAQIRPDVFFTPYFPAVFFADRRRRRRGSVSRRRSRAARSASSSISAAPSADSARLALLVMFWVVCGLTIWGVEHYRTIVAQQREFSKRLIEEEEYRIALRRRAATPAEEQGIDHPRRAAPGSAGPAAYLGPASITESARCPRPTI